MTAPQSRGVCAGWKMTDTTDIPGEDGEDRKKTVFMSFLSHFNPVTMRAENSRRDFKKEKGLLSDGVMIVTKKSSRK